MKQLRYILLMLAVYTFTSMQAQIPKGTERYIPKAIDLGLPSGTLWTCCNVGANAPETVPPTLESITVGAASIRLTKTTSCRWSNVASHGELISTERDPSHSPNIAQTALMAPKTGKLNLTLLTMLLQHTQRTTAPPFGMRSGTYRQPKSLPN